MNNRTYFEYNLLYNTVLHIKMRTSIRYITILKEFHKIWFTSTLLWEWRLLFTTHPNINPTLGVNASCFLARTVRYLSTAGYWPPPSTNAMWPSAELGLDQHRRRWAIIKPALGRRLVLTGLSVYCTAFWLEDIHYFIRWKSPHIFWMYC